MSRKIITLFLSSFLLISNLFASPPTRTYTYTSGNIIDPAQVTQNEDNIFNYLTSGVDTYADSTIVSADITDGAIVNADISTSAAIAYSKLSLSGNIVNADISASAAIALSKLASTPMLYTDTRFYVGNFTRDISSAGAQSITGVGFQPKGLILFGGINTGAGQTFWGMADSSNKYCIVDANQSVTDTYNIYTTYLGVIITGVGTDATISFTSFDSDGFTITWAKDGSPTGTATLGYVAFR